MRGGLRGSKGGVGVERDPPSLADLLRGTAGSDEGRREVLARTCLESSQQGRDSLRRSKVWGRAEGDFPLRVYSRGGSRSAGRGGVRGVKAGLVPHSLPVRGTMPDDSSPSPTLTSRRLRSPRARAVTTVTSSMNR